MSLCKQMRHTDIGLRSQSTFGYVYYIVFLLYSVLFIVKMYNTNGKYEATQQYSCDKIQLTNKYDYSGDPAQNYMYVIQQRTKKTTTVARV